MLRQSRRLSAYREIAPASILRSKDACRWKWHSAPMRSCAECVRRVFALTQEDIHVPHP